MKDTANRLRLVRAGIDTYQQAVVFMHRDCHVCRAEGFTALTRVRIRCGVREITATLNVVVGNRFSRDEAALSEAAWQALAPPPGVLGEIHHAEPPASAPFLRAKVFGARLDEPQLLMLMQ